MSYKQAYNNALALMSRGEIYYIHYLKKVVVLYGPDEGVKLNQSIVAQALRRGHVCLVGSSNLGDRYELTEKGKLLALKVLEARAWSEQK